VPVGRPRSRGRAPGGQAEGVAVRWHADGSRIPAPPSLDGHGRRVAWAYPPPNRVRLANPIVLLDLLARAAALTRHRRHLLTFPGGISVGPAASAAMCEPEPDERHGQVPDRRLRQEGDLRLGRDGRNATQPVTAPAAVIGVTQ